MIVDEAVDHGAVVPIAGPDELARVGVLGVPGGQPVADNAWESDRETAGLPPYPALDSMP